MMNPRILNIEDILSITPDEKAAIDKIVDAVIERYKHNSKAIVRLALENVVTLTASESRIKELTTQGFLARAIYKMIGKNHRLRDLITANLVGAQYTAVRMLQRITEQNMLNLKLTAAITGRLTDIYSQVGSNILDLESRVAKLEQLIAEKNGNLIENLDAAGVTNKMQKK